MVPRVVIVAVLASVLISIGGAALVIPGLIIAVYLWVIIPVAVVERPGLFGSFSRSAQLVRGNWWRVLGLVLIVSVPYIIAYVAVSEAIPSTEDLRVSGLVAQWIVLVLWAPFVCVTYVVCYHDLRAAQEAVEIEQPAQHSAVKSGRQKVIWIFYSVVGIVIGLIIVGGLLPDARVKRPNNMDSYAWEYVEKHHILQPGEDLVAYYDVTFFMDGSEAAIVTTQRVIYHKDGRSFAVLLGEIEDITVEDEGWPTDHTITIRSRMTAPMVIRIASMDGGEVFSSAIHSLWEKAKAD